MYLNCLSRMFTAFQSLPIADIFLIDVNQASLSRVFTPIIIAQSFYTNANKALLGRAFILTLAKLHKAEPLYQRQSGFVGQSLHSKYQASLSRASKPMSASPHQAEPPHWR